MASDIEYTQDVYNLVVAQKRENEEYINELYSSFSVLTFDDKLVATEVVSELKKLNFEYMKYIIAYEKLAKQDDQENKYIVVEGDTLPLISKKTLGDYSRWQEIFRLNELTDLVLEQGDILKIPRI